MVEWEVVGSLGGYCGQAKRSGRRSRFPRRRWGCARIPGRTAPGKESAKGRWLEKYFHVYQLTQSVSCQWKYFWKLVKYFPTMSSIRHDALVVVEVQTASWLLLSFQQSCSSRSWSTWPSRWSTITNSIPPTNYLYPVPHPGITLVIIVIISL